LDKYYKLAKEQGYRARSAFKLIHLNRKYDLLSKSRCVIDLCAAPGGWLQVAEKYMPKGGLIVGVDLDSIRPIPHVITFVSDITTPHCRTVLQSHLKHFKADLVLHDGAPNVGAAWVQDAFTQSELVLQSLKLATEFLAKGGSFVTKVFRSQDYNNLMWVFGQLFGRVEATKPPSSRNVSAEIFVVCRDFLAPKQIDPKFLDPKHVFKDLSSTVLPTFPAPNSTDAANSAVVTNPGATAAMASVNIFAPEKKKRNRAGYADNDYTLYREVPVQTFVHSNLTDAATILGSYNKMAFDKSDPQVQKWLESRHTTDEVLRNVDDLKVLGKSDFKRLLKWRTAIRLEVGLDVKKKDTEDAVDVEEEPVDEEEQLTEEMQRLHGEALARAKRERRKANEKKQRTIQRLQLNMTAPEDMVMEDDMALRGEDVFDLGEGEKEARRRGKGKQIPLDQLVQDADGMDESEEENAKESGDEDDEEILDSDEERERKTAYLEGELDGLYDAYRERMSERDAKWKVKQARLKDKNREAWHGIKDGSDGESDHGLSSLAALGRGGQDADSDEESEVGGWDVVANTKARIGEEVDSSDESAEESDGDDGQPKAKRVRLALPNGNRKPAAQVIPKSQPLVRNLAADVDQAEMSRAAQVWFDQPMFKGIGDLAALDGDDDDEEEGDEDVEEDDDDDKDASMEDAGEVSSDDGFEIVAQEPEDDGMEWDVDDEDQDEVKQKKIQSKGLLTAEAVTMATALVNRKTTADRLVDEGFNKHNFNSKDGLPTWFLDDEGKHYKPNLPVTKEAMQALRAKQRALDARPIKKVAEAKARKKFKAHQRLEKAKKKADGLMDAPDMSERARADQVQKVLGRATSKVKPKEVRVVVARGANRGVKGRPKGVKGRYKIVDPRMRKEVRALKRKTKANKKRTH